MLPEVIKFYESKLAAERHRRTYPAISKDAKLIHKHMDKRQHSINYRKCISDLGDTPCSFCKRNPARSSSQLIKDLPRKDQGGLFYGVSPDPSHPGHNKTFLQLSKEKAEIVPDGDIHDAERCQEEECLYVFKSNADSVRHMKLIHEKFGQQAHPLGFHMEFSN